MLKCFYFEALQEVLRYSVMLRGWTGAANQNAATEMMSNSNELQRYLHQLVTEFTPVDFSPTSLVTLRWTSFCLIQKTLPIKVSKS